MDAEVLLDGMLAKDRLLDLVENFILFDDSQPGGTRKIVARNHQVLGVNNAVASVQRQEELKQQFPAGTPPAVPSRRVDPQIERRTTSRSASVRPRRRPRSNRRRHLHRLRGRLANLPLIERAHPDLGRLGVFWHTQGSGKSYSMVVLRREGAPRTCPATSPS